MQQILANPTAFLLTALAIIAGIGFVVITVIGGAYVLLLWYRHRKRESVSLNSTLLQITVPRDNEIKIDAAEQMFSGIAAIRRMWSSDRMYFFKAQPHISFEIVGMTGDIRFYVHVPKEYKDFIEKQINGSYPDAEVVQVTEQAAKQRAGNLLGNEYNIFTDQGKVAFTSLRLSGADYQAIKAYKDLPVDPLLPLTSVMAKMGEKEGAAVQIMIRPAGPKWKKAGRGYIGTTKKTEANPDKASYKSDAKELESIENKIGKPGFETIIRIVVSSENKDLAKSHLNNIVNSFGQFTASHTQFKQNRIRFKGLFMTDFLYRYFPLLSGKSSVLSTDELATIFHLPNKSITTPGIHWLNSKRAPAPSNLPDSGLYIGKSTYRGLSRKVFIQKEDRQRHMYIIGKTGTGKSELLKQMIMQDIIAGEGVAVIDPHGDLVEDILRLIPPKRAEDVILFDPADLERPMGFNMLEAADEQQKHFVANSIIGLMYKLFDPNKTGIIGPRFEHAVRNAMLTVMYEEGSTFVEVVRVLTDQNYVQELLPKVQDPIIRRYWTDQIAQTSDFHKSEVLDYIVSKFGQVCYQ